MTSFAVLLLSGSILGLSRRVDCVCGGIPNPFTIPDYRYSDNSCHHDLHLNVSTNLQLLPTFDSILFAFVWSGNDEAGCRLRKHLAGNGNEVNS